jgi:RNase H-fold protein (predicted Holliday junction resolvase)
MDERLSSREVKEQLSAQGSKKAPQEIDSLAAAVILRSWFEQENIKPD